MADLVEYCYGNASTTWGRLRIQDGHPAPYKLRFVELGNEQYNTFYSEQAAAMEKRAIDLGVGGQYQNPAPPACKRVLSSRAVLPCTPM